MPDPIWGKTSGGETCATFITPRHMTLDKGGWPERREVPVATVDDYHRGWALRYLREAEVGLAAARETPSMAPKLVLDAMRKAQAAVYYSLGEPYFVEAVVQRALRENSAIEDPVLRCLVEIGRTVQLAASTPGRDLEAAIRSANNLIRTASDIVKLFTGEGLAD